MSYEDVAFKAKGDNDHVGLPVDVIAEMDADFRKASAFPEGFVSFVEATSSPDDSVHKDGRGPDGDTKLFVRVSFEVEADDMDAAEALPVPEKLLREIADAMSIGVEMEGNWEFADVDEAETVPGPR